MAQLTEAAIRVTEPDQRLPQYRARGRLVLASPHFSRHLQGPRSVDRGVFRALCLQGELRAHQRQAAATQPWSPGRAVDGCVPQSWKRLLDPAWITDREVGEHQVDLGLHLRHAPSTSLADDLKCPEVPAASFIEHLHVAEGQGLVVEGCSSPSGVKLLCTHKDLIEPFDRLLGSTIGGHRQATPSSTAEDRLGPVGHIAQLVRTASKMLGRLVFAPPVGDVGPVLVQSRELLLPSTGHPDSARLFIEQGSFT